MKYKEDKKSFYNTMSREKFIFFRLSLIFILMFSSIINLDFPYDKDCKETFPRLAESYWVVEEWNRTWGSGDINIANDITIGYSDKLLITGYIDNGNNDDILIIKYDSAGNQIWNKTWGGNGDDYGHGIAEDSLGNIYICGEKDWGVFGCGHLVVLKYDSSGNFIWSITLEDEPKEKGNDIAIDESNNLYVAGTCEKDFFLIKFNSNGNQIWNRTWGLAGKLDYLEEIEIDSNNDIIVGGSYNYEYGITNWNTLIAKFNSTGFQLWEDSIGGGTLPYKFRDLTLDSNDNVYLCFLTSNSYAWFYIFDSTGSRIRYDYLRQDGARLSHCYLHLDLNEYLYVFTTIDSTSPWQTSLYKLNNTLQREWKYSCVYDETNYEYAVEIAGDSNNNIYIVQQSQEGSIIDIIITKLTPSPVLNPSITINNGDNVTYSNKVRLTLSANGANEMCFRNGSMGDWTNWEPYNTFKQIFLEGSVNNTEYYISTKFRNQIGESQIVNDSIIYRTYDLVITPNSDNFSINIADIGFLLSWYAKNIGRMNDSYWITRNQTLISQGQWQHNTNITYYEMEALSAGIYNYTCFINDTLGKIVYSSIFVKVNLYPYISNIKLPENNVYSPNTEYTFNCSWFDDDGIIKKVKFEFNNKNYTVLTNHSGEFSHTLSNLPANESGYKFRWHGLDNNGAWNSTKLFTYILHKNNTQLAILFNGSSGNKYDLNINYINITIINLNSTPGKLQLYINSQLVEENPDQSLSYITLFVKGVYNITALLIHENYTGTSFNFLYIVKPPSFINQSEDFTMVEGEASREIFWDLYDENGSFWILRNGTEIYNGTWSNSLIVYNDLYLLSPGYYNFTCFINNTYGFKNSSSIIIKIIPNHYPNITNTTNNIIVNIGTSGFFISWYAFDIDNNNFSYWIERNQDTIETGIWKNNINIIYQEHEILSIGVYNYICFVNDTSGALNYSSISVTIINHEPQIVNNVNDFTINIGAVGYSLSWNVYDLDGNTDSYWIERNSIRIDEGTWNNDTDIIYIELDLLDVGRYNYTCFVNDSLGFMNQSSINIKINSFPQFLDIKVPSIDTYNPNLDYIFNCSWFDIDGIITEVKIEFNYQNYSVINNFYGEFTYIFKDLSANEIGYQFRWHAMDDDGTWNATEWQIFILNKQVIQLLILFNGTQNNLFDLYNPTINITIVNLNSTSGLLKLFVDNNLIQQEYANSLTNISQYLNGAYNITAVLVDQNYTGYAMLWLNIQEKTPPTIIFEFSDAYLNTTKPEYFHTSIELVCTVSDSSPLLWVYCCENSSGIFLNRSMVSLGNGNWSFIIHISNLNWNDVFIFYFIANDIWGNIGINDNLTSFCKIKIFDFQNPISTISYAPYTDPNIIDASIFFTIFADDVGSGISLVWYKINDSDWIEYTKSFNFSSYEPGTYDISYYSIDNAGNVEEIKSITVVLIKTEESTTQEAIPSFNLGILILIISITSIIILFKNKRWEL